MATKEIIELLFNADYRGQPEMQKLKKDVSSLADDFDKGVKITAAFTTALLGMEAAALAASIGLAKSGAEAAGKFNDGFNEIGTLVTASSDELERFKAAMKDYASGSTASLDDIQAATYNAISAGVEWQKSLDFLNSAEKLSVAGKADLNSVVQVLTGSLNAYGASADEAGAYSDVLFNTVKSGVTTIPELASSLGQVTGLAASLNIPFDELNSIIATLTANGLSTGNAITAIKGALTGIIKPTTDAKKAAEELGIGFDYSTLQSKGFAGMMQEIASKSQGNEQAVTRLFGSVEGLNAALSLTSESGAQTFLDKLNAIQNSTGATDEAFNKMKDNAALIKQTLQNNLELTLGAIGEPLLDEFKDVDKAIASIFSSIRKSIESESGLGTVVDAVEGIAQTVSQVINNMAQNMDAALATADLSGFTNGFNLINDAIKGLDLGSPEGLAKALESVGNAFESLTQFSVSAASVLKSLIEVFGSMAAYVVSLDTGTLELVGTIGGLAIAISAVSAVISPLIAMLGTLKTIGGIAGALGTPAVLSNATTALTGLAGAMTKLGVAGAAGTAGFFAGQWLVEGVDNLTGWSEKAAESTIAGDELTKGLERFRQETGNANATMAEYANHLKAKQQADSQAKQSTDSLAESQNKLGAALGEAVSPEDLKRLESMGQVLLDAEGNIVGFTTAAEDSAGAMQSAADGVGVFGDKVDGTGVTVKKATDTLAGYGQVAKATDTVLKTIQDFKPVFDFQTAKVKAEADKVKAIMDNLGTSTKSVSESLSSAFGVISSGEFADLNFWEKNPIIDSIRKQTNAQEKLVESQSEMAKAQAKYMNEKTRHMASGGALIKIDGTRLEPQLEAFMMEVLRAIQVRMAEEQADFLLGVSSI